MSRSAIGFDGGRDGAALVLATLEDDGTIRVGLLLVTDRPEPPALLDVSGYRPVPPSDHAPDPAMDFNDGSRVVFARPAPVLDPELWERARSVTFAAPLSLREVLERIDTLLDVDPAIGPDAARWSPDAGGQW